MVEGWFNLVRNTIFEKGIDLDDIYKFDETGFAMGLIATATFITRVDYYSRRSLLQPGNRGWVILIECTSASGFSLPLMIILKAETFIKR